MVNLDRFRGRLWALVPIGSIVVVIFAIRYVSDTATGLTYLALFAIPLLAAVALAWVVRGPKPGHPARIIGSVLATGALFALAWSSQQSLAGEGAAALLSALSCVTLGVLLAVVTPSGWLKVGIMRWPAPTSWLVDHRPAAVTQRGAGRGASRARACRSCRASCSAPSRWVTGICSSPACSVR